MTKTLLYVCYVLCRIPQLGRTWLYVGLVSTFLLDVSYVFVVSVGIVCFDRLTVLFFAWNLEEGLWVMIDHRCCWLLNMLGQFRHLFSIIQNCNYLYLAIICARESFWTNLC
jgi:hypothetical protein